MNLTATNLVQNPYKTRDLYFASLLYAMDIKLINVARDGKVCWFEFDDKNECEGIYKSFICKAVDVNAKKYEESIRTLKDLVFA